MATSTDTPPGAAGAPPKTTGLSRVPAVRALVDRLLHRARLDIAELHVHSLSDTGFQARAKLRLSNIGTGPLPLVKVKVCLPAQSTELHWIEHASAASSSKSGKRASSSSTPSLLPETGSCLVAHAEIPPFRLRPSAVPGAASAEIELTIRTPAGGSEALSRFVRTLLAAPAEGEPQQLVLRARGAEIKAYGMKFSGLSLEKIVPLGGLAGLGGVLQLPGASGASAGSLGLPSMPVRTRASDLSASEKHSKRRSWLSRASSSRASSSAVGTSSQTTAPVSTPGAPLEIGEFQIVAGHAREGIELSASVSLVNPSQSPALTFEPGELRFSLCSPSAKGSMVSLGSLTLASTPLRPGTNKVTAKGFVILPAEPPAGSASDSPASLAYAAGANLLSSLLQDEPIEICAVAQESNGGASPVAWLAAALKGAQIDARVPALGDRSRLLDGAELRVEGAAMAARPTPASPRLERGVSTASRNSNGAAGGSSVARATLHNSFGADIHVESLSVQALATELPGEGGSELELAMIQTPTSWDGLRLPAGGEGVATSLPIEINRDPNVLIAIMRRTAQTRGVDIGESLEELFDELCAGGGTAGKTPHGSKRNSVASSRAKGPRASGDADPSRDLASLLSRALADLRVTAHVNATARLGDYRIPGTLRFTQRRLPIALSTASSAALLPSVGAPFVGALAERAEVQLVAVVVHGMDEDGIVASAGLRLVNFGPLAASIRFDEPADLFRDGKKVARLFISGSVAVEPGMLEAVRTDVRLAPPTGAGATEAFGAVAAALLQEHTAAFELQAQHVVITAGGVEFLTPLNKTIKLAGLGGFPDLSVTHFSVLGEARPPAAGGSLLQAALQSTAGTNNGAFQICAGVTLVNPSDMTIKLARLELALSYDGAQVGQLALEDVVIEPYGETPLEARGLVYLQEDADREIVLPKLGEMISSLVAGREVKLGLRGARAWAQPPPAAVGGAAGKRRATSEPQRLSWLDCALASFSLSATLQQEPLRLVDGVDVGKLDASFPANGPPVITATDILIDYSLPYPIELRPVTTSADVEVIFDDVVVGRAKTREGVISDEHARSDDGGAKGTFTLGLERFELHTHDEAMMADLVSHVFDAGDSGTTRISLRGTAHVRVATTLGELPVTVDLGRAHRIRVAGLNSLRESPLQYSNFQVVDANPEYLRVTFSLFLNNPSTSMHIRLPDTGLSMGVYLRDTFVGRALIASGSFDMPGGPVAIHGVEFRYSPAREDRVRDLPSNLLSGRNTVLQVRGDDESTELPVLRDALSRIRMEFTLKPMLHELLESISVQLGPSVLTHSTVEATYVVRNPLAVPIDLCSLSFAATFRGAPFGSAQCTFVRDAPLRIAPGTPTAPGTQSGKIDVRLAQSLDKLVKTFLAERGQLTLELDVQAKVELQGFSIPVFDYAQSLPLHIEGLGGVSKLLSIF
ncbi:hypothetical protein FA09DRAFT_329114 [Tilletiopsis washingtonensis]|uniref:Uncharacterized protein n=1 Tax=Tilletiopsis washingtonensis TaxID=58919 RepID=A0A316ZBV0_9BASI|nr:hypothetical protein FA09DRAFT_329114 [Tilletiopsis washingtonensis]PWN99180.1 hypothetical protein FA09DRAFT_329114 [Tilletiopsis washingtonensis]